MGIFSQPLRPSPLRREYGDGRAERREHCLALVPVARDLLEDVQNAADWRAEGRRDTGRATDRRIEALVFGVSGLMAVPK